MSQTLEVFDFRENLPNTDSQCENRQSANYHYSEHSLIKK